MIGETFDDQFKCLMNKFSKFEIPRLRQVTINSNGTFFIDMQMKLQKPFTYLYQTVCLCMNQTALVKKNRETIEIAVKNFCREMNGETLLPKVRDSDIIIVEQVDKLTPKEIQIIDAFERNL
uniref:Phage protein n=1 Tax=Strongyloides venezuelensis TaxID=75913 RepID=A0A0K0FPR5_STRVS